MLALAMLPAITSRHAQAADIADVAALTGPDRIERLIDGARKEGGLQLYSSAAVENMGEIIAGFEKAYGLKVRVWKGSASDIRHRVLTESRAGRYEADVIETAGPEMEAMHREHLLQAVASPTLDVLIAGAIP